MTSWRELAACFSRHDWSGSLDPQTRDYIDALVPGQPLLVACSAGADSVFLSLILFARLADPEQRLHLVHFNHGLRGGASEADAEFVRDLASGLSLEVHMGTPETKLQADEASLREARYGWMIRLYHDLGAGGLVLGHHADDVVESQLMAVLTGSGPAGMAAPLPIKRFSDGHVRLRPMLAIRREQIIGFLRENRISWREDASNQDTGYLRNWLRQECIPRLRKRIPQDIYSGTQRTQRLMQECVESLDAVIDGLWVDTGNADFFCIESFQGQPTAVVRRAFMSWWMRHHSGIIINKGATDALVGLIGAGKRDAFVNIGGGQAIILDENGVLRITRNGHDTIDQWASSVHWNWRAGPLFLPDGAILTALMEQWAGNEEAPFPGTDPAREAWLDCKSTILIVRQWQPGDRYRPLGAPGSRKLQDIFVDAKLSVEQKHSIPVLTDTENNILWVPGFPPADDYRINRGCKSGLKLTYQPQ